jgi:hypothetical protein
MERCKLHEENISLKIKGVESHVKALIELQEQANKFQNSKLESILEQTLKTNGRVTEVEQKFKRLMFWDWLIDKPYRLVVSITILIVISKLITNEEILKLLLKLFA